MAEVHPHVREWDPWDTGHEGLVGRYVRFTCGDPGCVCESKGLIGFVAPEAIGPWLYVGVGGSMDELRRDFEEELADYAKVGGVELMRRVAMIWQTSWDEVLADPVRIAAWQRDQTANIPYEVTQNLMAGTLEDAGRHGAEAKERAAMLRDGMAKLVAEALPGATIVEIELAPRTFEQPASWPDPDDPRWQATS